MKSAQDLVKEFEDHLFQNGIAPKTIESYKTDVRLFHDYIQANGVRDVTQLKRFYVTNYKEWLQDGGYAIATINKKINSLQAYNLFLMKKQYLKEQVVHLGKDRVKIATGSQKEVDVLTDEQVTRLLFYVQDRSLVTKRNELIVMMLLYTGVRVSELCQIRLEDVDFLTNELAVYGKGGKHRQIPLRNDLVENIREYLKRERSQSKFADSRYLFVSQRTEKLARDSVNTMLEGIAKQVGFKIYPHMFRHTFCSRLVRKGVDLTTVSRLAGHQSVLTTSQFYVSSSRKEKLEAVNLL
ncbi:tyrosine-type recombinase/integrase [Neobacillus mesonae]|uniref:tyrosine-type recombinase/integrase n=1 Tax=Neobacillus mesonae TaxID=1193713 RepID=UPI00203E3C8D|nr:tyrosine-type recombinase/integrase [Neobacillus mesonae]MCM3567003.1 tyrosine-type recombinase/integrase [Neobacillus mesonae]